VTSPLPDRADSTVARAALLDPLDRRSFLRFAGAAAGATLIAGGETVAAPRRRSSAFTGKVMKYTSDSLLRGSGEVSTGAVKNALDECLAKLYLARDGKTVWKKLFKRNDVVGIKVNCLAGANLSTDPLVVQAVIEGLTSAGVKPGKIIIFERNDRELAKAGFELNRGGKGVQCYGTEKDYDSQLTTSGKVSTRLSKILSTTCTAIDDREDCQRQPGQHCLQPYSIRCHPVGRPGTDPWC